jgi:hypothetical protein
MPDARLRRIGPLSAASLRGARMEHNVKPNEIAEPIPEIAWVPPESLWVDEAYQREMGENSIKLIRKIVGNFSWRKLKPPIVVRIPGGYEVIDGQHTATAAATHDGVPKIPVLVVEAGTRAERADGFIGHNRDRVAVTPMQLFFSALAAEDPEATTIKHVCDRAGVTIVKYPKGGRWEPGQTVAVSAIGRLIEQRYTLSARRVLKILADSDAAPITANQIKAVEALLFDREFVGKCQDDQITDAIRGLAEEAEREAGIMAVTHKIPQWKALTIVYFRGIRNQPGRAA